METELTQEASYETRRNWVSGTPGGR